MWAPTSAAFAFFGGLRAARPWDDDDAGTPAAPGSGQHPGDRAYRLLGCTLTYHGDLPKVGETIRYDIHVDGHANPTMCDTIEDHKNRAAQLKDTMRDCSAALAVIVETREKVEAEIGSKQRAEALKLWEKHKAHCERGPSGASKNPNNLSRPIDWQCVCGYSLYTVEARKRHNTQYGWRAF